MNQLVVGATSVKFKCAFLHTLSEVIFYDIFRLHSVRLRTL